MSISLRQLRALVMAVDSGSFGRAATRLHVTQPALTVQIRGLEERLGITLFDRSARGVRPTEAGLALARSFARILEELDGTVAGARDLAARRSGTVHLAVLPSVAATLLPQALARLRQAHPGIRVLVRDSLAHRVAEQVKAGATELGIGTLPGPDAELDGEPLFEDELVAVLPPGHALTAAMRVTPAILAEEPLILTDPGSSLRVLAERAFAEAGLVLRPAYEATYMSTAVALVRAGLGIGVLPATALDLRLAPVLETRPIAAPAMRRRILLLRRHGSSLSPAADALAEALRATIAAPRLGSPGTPSI
ncbi:LysR family transcriptional regulator [Roseomonas marmotae]|uniref:LysR family transcriptional regulator n=1 Tax=Roseomonas marmotae TaxID=2768161 RepID=A0ABS3K7M1_9PROT|nr:LysR family transcriptional regulator [Roseomonas marmotae]MBO1073466.1 LysR family transcriptional regulator [Roseomonas marmotae]QTI80340.1 LysR family transcriptional regulator [Roseomonas marmotae]